MTYLYSANKSNMNKPITVSKNIVCFFLGYVYNADVRFGQ